MTEPNAFSPTLCTTGWSEEWKRLQAARRVSDDPARWNERARSYGGKRRHSAYAARFIELWACVPGNAARHGLRNGCHRNPRSRSRHRVIARDFSRAMLDELERQPPRRAWRA